MRNQSSILSWTLPDTVRSSLHYLGFNVRRKSLLREKALKDAKALHRALDDILSGKTRILPGLLAVAGDFGSVMHALAKHDEHLTRAHLARRTAFVAGIMMGAHDAVHRKVLHLHKLATLHAFLTFFEVFKQEGRNQLAGLFALQLQRLDILNLERGVIDVKDKHANDQYKYDNLTALMMTAEVMNEVIPVQNLELFMENLREAGRLEALLKIGHPAPEEVRFTNIYHDSLSKGRHSKLKSAGYFA